MAQRTAPPTRSSLRNNSYYIASSDTLLRTVMALALGSLIALLLYSIADKMFLSIPRPLLVLFFIYWLWLSEAWWFGLTTRRFANIQYGIFTIYGAFGRIRWQGRLVDHRFYYFGTRRQWLTIESSTDARTRTFSLHLCREHETLLNALRSSNRLTETLQTLKKNSAQHSKPQWAPFYVAICVIILPIISASQIIIFRPFWHLHLQKSAWYWGITAGFVLILPLAWFFRRYKQHFRAFSLPAHHYWRKTWLGNTAANIHGFINYTGTLLTIAAFYGLFFAHNLAWLSLISKPWYSVEAHISPSGKCYRGRYDETWKMHVQLSEPYQRFDDNWCSFYSTKDSPPISLHTVYFRESAFARELRFNTE